MSHPTWAATAVGGLAIVVATVWAGTTEAADVEQAVTAVALGTAGLFVGLAAMGARVVGLRRAVARRTGEALARWEDGPDGPSPSDTPDNATVDALSLVTLQLERYSRVRLVPARRRTR